MEIEINGVHYEPIPQKPRVTSAKSATMMAAMMGLFTIHNPYGHQPARPKPLPTNNLVKEFELIQAKQSKLSRSERDAVVHAFHRAFRVVQAK